jgi:hypothetical protein
MNAQTRTIIQLGLLQAHGGCVVMIASWLGLGLVVVGIMLAIALQVGVFPPFRIGE